LTNSRARTRYLLAQCQANQMNILFIHQNYPGQFRESLPRLAASGKHKIVFLTQRQIPKPPTDHAIAVYKVSHKTDAKVHRMARLFDTQVAVGVAVRDACAELKKRGFKPDLIVGHCGWGETLFVKDVFPDARMASYFEYYFIPKGGCVGYDPEYPESPDVATLLHARNAHNYLTLERSTAGFTATEWQRQTFPKLFHPMLEVVHEGIRSDRLTPNHDGPLEITIGDVKFQRGDELVSYIARNLEPIRGSHTMLRSLPALQKARPKARVAIIGGDAISYGQSLPAGVTFRDKMVRELGATVDWSRVHFLGNIPYPQLVGLLQLAQVHVYLTAPFVISWSMMEAMALEKTIIASDVAPIRQFIQDGQTGLLTDFFKPEALAEKLVAVLAKPDRYRHLGLAARKEILNTYDFNTIAYPAFVRFLDRVAAKKIA
jgi:glycosyltransferase involved in cell wall biosynthesis